MPAGLAVFLRRRIRWLLILPPLLFLCVFFLIPFAFAFKISFADLAIAIPPFTKLLSRDAGRALCADRYAG